MRERINPCFVPSVKSKEIPSFKIGDQVLVLNLRPGPKWFKATITQIVAKNIYMVHVHKLETEWKRHLSQMLPLTHETNESNQDVFDDKNLISNEHATLASQRNAIQSNENASDLVLSPTENSNVDISNDSVSNNDSNDLPAENSSSVVTPNVIENTSEPVNTDSVLRRSSRIKKPVERFEAGK